MTLALLKKLASSFGFVVTLADSEFRIAPSLKVLAILFPSRSRYLLRMKQESYACYETDADAAEGTLKAMATEIATQNNSIHYNAGEE